MAHNILNTHSICNTGNGLLCPSAATTVPHGLGEVKKRLLKAHRQQYNLPYFALFRPKGQIKDDDVTIILQMARFRITRRHEGDEEEITGNHLSFSETKFTMISVRF